MLAAETAFDALAGGGCDAAALQKMQERFEASWAYEELRSARNFHAGFENGLLAGMLNVGLGMFTGGRGFGVREHLPNHAGHTRMRHLEGEARERDERVTPDNVVTFDKLTDVFHSGTKHDEDQPSHLHVADMNICAQRCTAEFGNPCQYFCPAKVYEPLFERKGEGEAVEGRLQINFANCVHCKTCDIMDPYQIITWVPPRGGDGPVYTNM
jgi:electron-transferring-flavoprotein dehydrogenase